MSIKNLVYINNRRCGNTRNAVKMFLKTKGFLIVPDLACKEVALELIKEIEPTVDAQLFANVATPDQYLMKVKGNSLGRSDILTLIVDDYNYIASQKENIEFLKLFSTGTQLPGLHFRQEKRIVFCNDDNNNYPSEDMLDLYNATEIDTFALVDFGEKYGYAQYEMLHYNLLYSHSKDVINREIIDFSYPWTKK